ncbi:MAG: acireductone dioxygenase [Lysobacteraceae bacterium]|nr:MAG: acireductone dioxygenase [Xanthomonadaceae bacterium]
MSRLRIFSDHDPEVPLFASCEAEAIRTQLQAVGVRYERWPLRPLPAEAAPERILETYREEVERLRQECGYQAVDVVSLRPDHPDRQALREKFLSEHTHSEDEVRFFVAGSGLFSLHIGNRVYEVLCTAGDLIGVPDGTRHWFDMGPEPFFVAIRLFTNPEGWVARYTGDGIASRFPRHEGGDAA